MSRDVSSELRGRPLPTAAAVVTLLLCLSFVAMSRSRITQTSSASQADKPTTRPNLVVVASDVREQTIRFGEELVVLVTLQNQGKDPIKIPADALVLKNDGWIGYP